MKRLFISCIVALTAFVSANAQFMDFSNNNRRFGLGLNFGQVGTTTEYARFGMGANLEICGFYADFIWAEPQHKYDNHFGSDTKWNDNQAFAINGGYMFPILPWLRIMPLAGYAQTNEGVTDASTLNISTSENSSTLYHDYIVDPTTRKEYFNYGGGISIQPIKWVSIHGVYTKYAIYGGFKFDLGALFEK